jgi:hypothetical protein
VNSVDVRDYLGLMHVMRERVLEAQKQGGWHTNDDPVIRPKATSPVREPDPPPPEPEPEPGNARLPCCAVRATVSLALHGASVLCEQLLLSSSRHRPLPRIPRSASVSRSRSPHLSPSRERGRRRRLPHRRRGASCCSAVVCGVVVSSTPFNARGVVVASMQPAQAGAGARARARPS